MASTFSTVTARSWHTEQWQRTVLAWYTTAESICHRPWRLLSDTVQSGDRDTSIQSKSLEGQSSKWSKSKGQRSVVESNLKTSNSKLPLCTQRWTWEQSGANLQGAISVTVWRNVGYFLVLTTTNDYHRSVTTWSEQSVVQGHRSEQSVVDLYRDQVLKSRSKGNHSLSAIVTFLCTFQARRSSSAWLCEPTVSTATFGCHGARFHADWILDEPSL